MMKQLLLPILFVHSLHAMYIEPDAGQPISSYDTGQWIASHDCSENAQVYTSVLRTYLAESKKVQIGNTCFTIFKDNSPIMRSSFRKPSVKLSNNKNINFEKDQIVRIAQEPWGLDRIDSPLDNHPLNLNYNGSGVTIYVLDTGINIGHREFTGRVKLGGDFIKESNSLDGHGHGTHTAGTAAGSSYGVARGANIVAVKVLNRFGTGSTTSVIQGIEWAVKKSAGKTNVISMSLGSGPNAAVNKAVISAYKAGMIVVVAAGNDNDNACEYSPASTGGKRTVITVAATDINDKRASYSNFGECVDIFAPGSNIKSSWKGSNIAYSVISGTSMATPHVAGVMAVLLQQYNGNKSAAQTKLFELAAYNKVNDPLGTPNLLLQLPKYEGLPTDAPTFPPSRALRMCVGGICTDQYFTSTYCPTCDDSLTIVNKTLINATTAFLCSKSLVNYTGKVVFIEMGGCFFYDKTKNAEIAGAFAVVIYQHNNYPAYKPYIPPGSVFKSKIQTYMISKADFRKFWSTNSTDWMIGVTGSTSSSPTKIPTKRAGL